MKRFENRLFDILLILFFFGCSRTNDAPAEFHKTESPIVQNELDTNMPLTCIPDSFHVDEKLAIGMLLPHGGDLAIIDPAQRFFFIANSRASGVGGMGSVIDNKEFSTIDTLIIDPLNFQARPSIHGVTEQQLVFVAPGVYEVRLGENLQTGGHIPMSTCSVYFSGR